MSFLSFYPLKTPKIKILKNEKIYWRYNHFTHVYHKLQYMMYGSWDMEWDRQNFLSFWAIFCRFTNPPKKWKKCLEILSYYTYMCTINEDHMLYGSSNVRCVRQKFSSFWTIFCPFSPLTTWKITILTFYKTPGDMIILHICTINDNHMMYGFWDMEHNRHNFLSFWTVFCPFTPHIDPENKIFEKIKEHLKILSFYKCVP